MSQSLSDIVLHVVFSTKDRQPWIKTEIEEELYKYMRGIALELKCPIIEMNGVEDHVHILLHLNAMTSASDVISKLKSNSSRWMKAKGIHYNHFSWQSGYAAFSVSRPIVEGAVEYVAQQKTHHKKVSFKEELLAMLKRAEIEYDEKYLWN